MASLTAQEIRARFAEVWGSVAEGWVQYEEAMNRFLAPATDALLEMAALEPGQYALDVACGVGQPGLSALETIGAEGRLIGVDIAMEMVQTANRRAQQMGLENVDFRWAEMEHLPFVSGAFDRALCRYGIMFSPEPIAAAAECLRVLDEGGRFAGCVWSQKEQNSWAGVAMNALDQYMDYTPAPGSPGAFALGTEEKLNSVLSEAGFSSIEIRRVNHVYTDTTAEAYWQQVQTMAGPIQRALKKLSDEQRSEAERQIIEGYQRELDHGGIKGESLCFAAVK